MALQSLSTQAEDPFTHTAEIMYRYFQSKLFLASEHLDPMTLESALMNKVSNPLILEAVAITKICDAGRFGPEASEAKDTLQMQAGELLKQIDGELA